MSVRWQTLIADENGTIDYVRVRQLVSVILGIAGGCLMIAAAAVEILKLQAVPSGNIALIGGGLVLPITGGQIAGAIVAKRTLKEEPGPEAAP